MTPLTPSQDKALGYEGHGVRAFRRSVRGPGSAPGKETKPTPDDGDLTRETWGVNV